MPDDGFFPRRTRFSRRGRGGGPSRRRTRIASPGQSRYKKDHRAAGLSGLPSATPTPCSAMTDEIVCRIDALAHDGRGNGFFATFYSYIHGDTSSAAGVRQVVRGRPVTRPGP